MSCWGLAGSGGSFGQQCGHGPTTANSARRVHARCIHACMPSAGYAHAMMVIDLRIAHACMHACIIEHDVRLWTALMHSSLKQCC